MGPASNKTAQHNNKPNISNEQTKEVPVYPKWHNLIAGATAGAGARFLTAPLDLIKIRRQLNVPPASATAAAAATPAVSSLKFPSPTGLFKSLKHIVQTEGGLPSLFRGNLAATYLWIGYAAVQFSLYARTSEMLASYGTVPPPMVPPTTTTTTTPIYLSKPGELARWTMYNIGTNPTAVAFCSGAAAGTAATLATYPFDICRTAFAMRGLSTSTAAAAASTATATTKTSIQSFFSLATSKGIHNLFAGSGPAVLGIIPYMGLNFALYDYLIRNGKKKGVGEAGMAGAIAGGTSKIIVYPLDTVKKRLQAQAFETFWGSARSAKGMGAGGVVGGPSSVPYKNMVDCAVRVFKEEGLVSFYRGLVPTVMKSMAATGFTFSVYTMTKNTLEKAHDWRSDKFHAINNDRDK